MIGKGLLAPQRELLFLPSGGVGGIKAVVPIIFGKNEELPFVVLDADTNGFATAKSLQNNLYKGVENRILTIDKYVGFSNSETEDIFPTIFLSDVITKYLCGPKEDFSEVVRAKEPIVPQIESYTKINEIELPISWKVEVAKLAKARMLKTPM